jgi:hypothetical protein
MTDLLIRHTGASNTVGGGTAPHELDKVKPSKIEIANTTKMI